MSILVKSILVTEFGGYDSLVVTDFPLAELKSDSVEVEVYYCGVNFADLYTRQGLIPKESIPFVLGIECSGIISSVGKNATSKFKVGDRVICYNHNGGLYRDKVIVPTSKCYILPDSVSLRDAAALFVNYLTAYISLRQLGNLHSNQHILINSCAGGVGWAATQLASLVDGTTIYGTTSAHKADAVAMNGVHHVLGYDTYADKIKEIRPQGLDLIIDNQAGQNVTENMHLLNSFGKLVLIGANNLVQDENQLNLDAVVHSANANLSLSHIIMNSTCVAGLHLGIISEKHPSLINDNLNILFNLLSSKKINIQIDSIWPLDSILEATKRLQERRNVGKVLLRTDRCKNNVH